MRIFMCEQRSIEWLEIRKGIPTASQFDRILSPVKQTPSTSQSGYIDELLAKRFEQSYEIYQEEGFISKAMQDGIDGEPAARAWYSFDRDVDVREVGFCLSSCGRFGCSPDGLVEPRGLIEIKKPLLKTHIKWLREGVLPNDYKCQVHGELLATELDWVDFISYSPCEDLPNLVVRVVPDKFTKLMDDELQRFLERYQYAMEKLGLQVKRPIDTVSPVAEV
jgi:hypothetical protein